MYSNMNIFVFNMYFCAILFFLVNSGQSLRCRSGNQQTNNQVHKIMQTCRKKYSSNNNGNGNDYMTSSGNDSSDEDSASSMSLDEELFFGNNNKQSSGNNSKNNGNYGQSSDRNYGENHRNDRRKQNSSINNRMSAATSYNWTNDRLNGMANRNENPSYYSGPQSPNRENNNDDRNHSECVTQCFFDELNLVDQRGFPERGSVMEMMTREIQDPNLRDFIEQSISECFYYLDSDPNNREKCAFSNNLMSCFAEKGRDRCEDWDD